MNGDGARIQSLAADVKAALGFYTRLPLSDTVPSFAAAQWAAPLAGAAVGLFAGLVLLAAMRVGAPASVAAALAVGAGMLATGALHEDGLGDVADGFGGGRTREEKLAIMRDSRVGSYGVLALGVTTLIRFSALSAVAAASGGAALLALIAAHAASRGLMPLFAARVPPAREDGLSAGMGPVESKTAYAALALGGFFLVLAGPGFALMSAVLLAIWFWFFKRLARHQIGGQTGDVLGTLQQGGEIAVLFTASIILA